MNWLVLILALAVTIGLLFLAIKMIVWAPVAAAVLLVAVAIVVGMPWYVFVPLAVLIVMAFVFALVVLKVGFVWLFAVLAIIFLALYGIIGLAMSGSSDLEPTVDLDATCSKMINAHKIAERNSDDPQAKVNAEALTEEIASRPCRTGSSAATATATPSSTSKTTAPAAPTTPDLEDLDQQAQDRAPEFTDDEIVVTTEPDLDQDEERGTTAFSDGTLTNREEIVTFINGTGKRNTAARDNVVSCIRDSGYGEDEVQRALNGEGYAAAMQLMVDSELMGNTYYQNGQVWDGNEWRSVGEGDFFWLFVAKDGKIVWCATLRADCANPGLDEFRPITEETPPAPAVGTPSPTSQPVTPTIIVPPRTSTPTTPPVVTPPPVVTTPPPGKVAPPRDPAAPHPGDRGNGPAPAPRPPDPAPPAPQPIEVVPEVSNPQPPPPEVDPAAPPQTVDPATGNDADGDSVPD